MNFHDDNISKTSTYLSKYDSRKLELNRCVFWSDLSSKGYVLHMGWITASFNNGTSPVPVAVKDKGTVQNNET